ncbi:MAG: hypothetical protein MJ189_05140 [Coriobacteriales bacterium]|nr:hypothetical protein [Coriobacteriales bacterium]
MQDYLAKIKAEGISIMDMLYDEEYIEAVHKKSERREGFEDGMKQGIEQGIEQGEIFQTVKLYNKGLISLDDAATSLNISSEEFEKLLNE